MRARPRAATLTTLELAPTDARFSYVLAVALAGSGERDEAVRVLETILEHRPTTLAPCKLSLATCATRAKASARQKCGRCSTRY